MASEDQISEGNILWLPSFSLADIPYNGDWYKCLDWVYFKNALSKGMLILKTVATFVHETGLFWLLSGFCFDYSVHRCHFWLKTFNHWDKRDMYVEKKLNAVKITSNGDRGSNAQMQVSLKKETKHLDISIVML